MGLTRLRNRGKRHLYTSQVHYTSIQQVKALTSREEGFPADWEEFEAFALACKTRQKGGIKGLSLYDWQRSLMQLSYRSFWCMETERKKGVPFWTEKKDQSRNTPWARIK